MSAPELPLRSSRHERDGHQEQPQPEPTPARPEVADRSPLWEVAL